MKTVVISGHLEGRARLYKRSCKGKIKYRDLTGACRAIRIKTKGVEGCLQAYRCQFCGNYHVGHKSRVWSD